MLWRVEAMQFTGKSERRHASSPLPDLPIRQLGQNRCAVVPLGNVGATPSSCIFEEVRLRHHGGLLAAAVPYRKGASHDCSSTTNDRGYAGTEFFASYPGILSPTGFAVRAPLR